jgi:hypothetical protein
MSLSLQQDVDELRTMVRELVDRIHSLEATNSESRQHSDEAATGGTGIGLDIRGSRISRGRLLSAAAAGGIGIAAAGLLSPTVAGAETEKLREVCRNVRVTGPTSKSGIGVDASSSAAGFKVGVYGASKTGIGVEGSGATGVLGSSSTVYGAGVHGWSTGYGGDGVLGTSSSGSGNAVTGINTSGEGIGVAGEASGNGTGVAGIAGGYGVKGQSTGGYDGVTGTTSGLNGGAGVRGDGGDHGYGVSGRSPYTSGVHGESTSGPGMEGRGRVGVFGGATADGYGVHGDSLTGVGSYFSSGSGPQLHLQGASTRPAGAAGDFFVDNSGNLYYYSASGWVQLA